MPVNSRVPLMARRVWGLLSSCPVSGARDATRCASRAALVLRISALGAHVSGVGTAPTESVALTPTEPRRSGAVFRRAGQLDDSAVGVARVVCRVVSLVYPFGGGTSVEREQTGSTADSGTRVSGDRGGGAVISFTILKHLFRSVSPWKSVQRGRERGSVHSYTGARPGVPPSRR